jgi:charged multivesicular body protein 4
MVCAHQVLLFTPQYDQERWMETIISGSIATNYYFKIAARAALRRKKQHEHTLEQTTAQISTLEQQIYSIEAANINRETLAAMERAGEAMQQIHGKLNIDKVDETMYGHFNLLNT